MPIGILLVARFEQIARRLTPEFAVHHLPAAPERAQFLAETGPQIRGIVTSTAVGVPVDAALLAALPNVEIIANMWVGYDTVDMTAASSSPMPAPPTQSMSPSTPSDSFSTSRAASPPVTAMFAPVPGAPRAGCHSRTGLRAASSASPVSVISAWKSPPAPRLSA
jgi:hypothetical protein